jgi:hypothetical protein
MAVPGRSSPYRLEINPWALDDELMRVHLARGAFLAGVAELEIGLTEIAIRLSRLSEYQSLRGSFPSRRKDRMRFLRAACNLSGSLSRFAPALEKIIIRYENFWDYRDLLAHARMRVLSLPDGDATIELSDYYAQADQIAHRIERASLHGLEKKARRVCRAARAFNYLYSLVDNELPSLD